MPRPFETRMQEKRRHRKRQGVSLFCGLLLFAACFLIYFLSETEWVQKEYLYPYPYRATVERYARSYGVDSSLAAGVILAESRFQENAHSHRGAVGLMQLMPETGAWIAAQLDDSFSTAHLAEPAVNIRYGIWYLGELEKEFSGNDILALAAYNAGRGNVREWMERYGWTRDFSDVRAIPYAETREYVAHVLKYQKKYAALYTSAAPVLSAARR